MLENHDCEVQEPEERFKGKAHFMNKAFIMLLVLASSRLVFGQGVLLGPGQSYVFEFNSLPYLRPVSPGETGTGNVVTWLDPASYASSGSVRIDCFANTLSDTPITGVWTLPLVSQNPNVGLLIT